MHVRPVDVRLMQPWHDAQQILMVPQLLPVADATLEERIQPVTSRCSWCVALSRNRFSDPLVGDKIEVSWEGRFRLESLDVFVGRSWWEATVVEKLDGCRCGFLPSTALRQCCLRQNLDRERDSPSRRAARSCERTSFILTIPRAVGEELPMATPYGSLG